MGEPLNKKILSVKLKQNKRLIYKHKINSEDFKQLAILFLELRLHGCQIEKAYEEYLKNQKGEKFPW